ncbi:uridylate-specific endoribonuclease-like [Styela clava]
MLRSSFLILLWITCWTQANSEYPQRFCAGECGGLYNVTAKCQCDDACPFFGNCCPDYISICNDNKPFSCSSSCKSTSKNIFSCEQCMFHSDTCVTDDELHSVTSSLWEYRSFVANDLDIQVDRDGDKYFSYVNDRVSNHEGFVQLSSIFDNYEQDWETKEPYEYLERKEEVRLINYFVQSKIGNMVYKFLRKKGLAGCGYKWEFRHLLRRMWSFKFKRHGMLEKGSNGLENVFVGETHNGAGIGLNNWYRVYQLEKFGEIKLQTINNTESRQRFQRLKYDWNGATGVTSIFVGASPEWEFAIYTLCHLTRSDRSCWITAKDQDGKPFKVEIKSEYMYHVNMNNELSHVSNVFVF